MKKNYSKKDVRKTPFPLFLLDWLNDRAKINNLPFGLK